MPKQINIPQAKGPARDFYVKALKISTSYGYVIACFSIHLINYLLDIFPPAVAQFRGTGAANQYSPISSIDALLIIHVGGVHW